MSSIRVVLGIICMVLAVIARGIWAETTLQPPAPAATYGSETAAVSEPGVDDRAWEDPSPSRRMDRYGNPIDTAIGDYRIDPRGEVYESHSPDTAVPRLGVPSA